MAKNKRAREAPYAPVADKFLFSDTENNANKTPKAHDSLSYYACAVLIGD
mgnify:CR=1 FL=1